MMHLQFHLNTVCANNANTHNYYCFFHIDIITILSMLSFTLDGVEKVVD